MNKLLFPLLKEKEITYLDSGATTQKFSTVIKAIEDYYTSYCSNVHRSIYKISTQATKAYEGARKTVAQFLNAQTKEIIFTKNATEGFNLLAYSLIDQCKKADHIILSVMEHHSNFVPWQTLAKEKGIKVDYIGITPSGELDLKQLQETISEKTKIVSITHISNVLGTINPIKKIAKIVHEKNAVLVVDGAQSAGHIPIDVKKLDCDFFVCSGHKMYGPTGIGVVYGKKELLEDMKPFLYGGDMIKEVSVKESTWAQTPHKFEAGTPPIAQAIGLAAAINTLKKIGMKKIEEQEKEITQYTLAQLATIKDITLYGPKKNRASIFSFTLKGIHAYDLASFLGEKNICVRAGHHCAQPLHKALNCTNTVRISLGMHNTKKDIDRAVQEIKKIQKVLTK